MLVVGTIDQMPKGRSPVSGRSGTTTGAVVERASPADAKARDQRLFALDPDRYDAFVHALDNPPAPGPKLRALLRRVPAWRT